MVFQNRVTIIWLSWLTGGACGVTILLLVICYCRLMPRHQKSFDEQYLKENFVNKENYVYFDQEQYRITTTTEMSSVCTRPASYAGSAAAAAPAPRTPSPTVSVELEADDEALRTRSLPGCLRARPRPAPRSPPRSPPRPAPRAPPRPAALPLPPLQHPPLDKASGNKKYKQRMRSEHAAIIALSRSRALPPDAVVVYHQRTQL